MPELASLFTLDPAGPEAMLLPVDPLCTHDERTEGKCPACGSCDHDLVLNGACYYCGETDLKLTIKPAQDELVTLRPKRSDDA